MYNSEAQNYRFQRRTDYQSCAENSKFFIPKRASADNERGIAQRNHRNK